MNDIASNVLKYIKDCKLEDLIKIAGVCISARLLWPIIRSYGKVYDITVINRLDESVKFVVLRAQTGDIGVKGSGETTLASKETCHYQIVPAWRGIYGSETMHIRIQMTNKEERSVIIPIYNSGDIQKSRVFFIEQNGLREINTTENDIWSWSTNHTFGQQGN